MPIPKSEKIWFNGKLVNWDDAKIHVMSHVIHYGSSVFEGVRCYNTSKGSAVFCLQAHVQRLLNSAKIYRMNVGYSADELANAILETIRANKLKECYIRPIIFRGYGEIGVNPLGCPLDVAGVGAGRIVRPRAVFPARSAEAGSALCRRASLLGLLLPDAGPGG